MKYEPLTDEQVDEAIEDLGAEYFIQGEQVYSKAMFEVAKVRNKLSTGEINSEEYVEQSDSILGQCARHAMERLSYYRRKEMELE